MDTKKECLPIGYISYLCSFLYSSFYIFFLNFAMKNPSNNSFGQIHIVPGILVGSFGRFFTPSQLIGTTCIFP